MKTPSIVVIAFFAGIFVAASPLTISNNNAVNADNLKLFVSQSVADALSDIEDKENQRLDELPDVMNCSNMTWMSSCEQINRNAKKNPTAHLRVFNKDGLEFNFVPGTPSPMVNYQLDPSPENAARIVTYFDEVFGQVNSMARYYDDASVFKGPLKHSKSLDRILLGNQQTPAINTKGIQLSVFIDSEMSETSLILKNLSDFKRRHLSADIRIYQVNNDKAGLKTLLTNNPLFKAKSKILQPADLAKVKKISGGDSWPLIWVDKKQSNYRDILVGVKTVKMLETALTAADKYRG